MWLCDGQCVSGRTRGQGDSKYRLTVDELALFHEHIDQLACRVPEQGEIKRLLDQVCSRRNVDDRLKAAPHWA